MNEKMIEIQGITKSFGELQVLKGINLIIYKGEVVSVVGPSGAGKTTLLQIMGTLDKADCGSVVINGIEVGNLKEKELSAFRNKQIGFVFQFHQLLPEFTALENVCIPGYIASRPKAEVEARARELLELVGLKGRMTHKPSELSGGEQQRVAIARALANNPSVVLADEPTGNLDSATREDIQKLFFELRERKNQTFIIVTHDDALAQMSDRKIVMSDGRI